MQRPYRHIAAITLIALLVGSAVGLRALAAGTPIFLPVVRNGEATQTPPATAVPTTPVTPAAPPVVPPADAASARLKVPAGFAVRIFASGLQSPRLMTIGPDGALYVAERGANDVVRLVDANNDGLADGKQVVATGFDGPHSLEWHDGSLYVADNIKVYKLTDTNNNGVFTDSGEQTAIETGISSGGNHSSRTIHFGPDGKMYVSAGSTGNNSVESDKRRAAISRFNLDGSIPSDNPFATDTSANGSRKAVWAEGLRNSIDFLFMPNGQLWANHNGSDSFGDDSVPPEEVVINVEKGKHYGWPFCYTPSSGKVAAGTQEVRDTRVQFAAPVSSCADVNAALLTAEAHAAPIGMALYNKAAFPQAYQGNIFEAYHGSWNTSGTNNRDCKVEMITLQNNVPVNSSPFLTGFRTGVTQKCGDAWGRPAGVTVGPQGELFVSDDKNGNVYRIVYVGL